MNGHAQPPLTLTRDSKPYTVMVDPAWVDLSGDVRLDFTHLCRLKFSQASFASRISDVVEVVLISWRPLSFMK